MVGTQRPKSAPATVLDVVVPAAAELLETAGTTLTEEAACVIAAMEAMTVTVATQPSTAVTVGVTVVGVVAVEESTALGVGGGVPLPAGAAPAFPAAS